VSSSLYLYNASLGIRPTYYGIFGEGVDPYIVETLIFPEE